MDEQQKLTRESPAAAGAEPLNEADLARVLDILQGAIKPRS